MPKIPGPLASVFAQSEWLKSEWDNTVATLTHKHTEHGLHAPLCVAFDGHLNGRSQNLPGLKWCVCMDLVMLPSTRITLG
jgi:hypothetical protein